jgi:hypothetical protein
MIHGLSDAAEIDTRGNLTLAPLPRRIPMLPACAPGTGVRGVGLLEFGLQGYNDAMKHHLERKVAALYGQCVTFLSEKPAFSTLQALVLEKFLERHCTWEDEDEGGPSSAAS